MYSYHLKVGRPPISGTAAGSSSKTSRLDGESWWAGHPPWTKRLLVPEKETAVMKRQVHQDPWNLTTKARETGRNQLLSVYSMCLLFRLRPDCLAEGSLGFDPTLETHGWIVWWIACHKLPVFNCFCLLGIYRKLPPQLFVFRRILAANNVTMDILATNPTGSLVSQLAYPAVAVDTTWKDWEIHKMGMFLSIPYSMCFRICVHACMMYV